MRFPVPTRLLIVGNGETSRSVTRSLRLEGFSVSATASIEAALQRITERACDAVVLVLTRNDREPRDASGTLRKITDVPIVLVTPDLGTDEIVQAYERGADVVLTTPFEIKELAARVRSVVRRTDRDATTHRWIRLVGDLEIRANEGIVRRDGDILDLTPIEFQLLCTLVEHDRRVLDREELVRSVWGDDPAIDERTIYTHVHRLRSKVERDPSAPEYIQTVRGFGYRFVSPPDDTESRRN